MDKVWGWVEIACAAVGGAAGYFFGEFDGFFIALLIFMCLDIVTGIIRGCIEKKLSSKVSFKGMAKKVFILLLVGIGNVIDTLIFPDRAILRTMIIFFYIANEGISILENIAESGLPIPQKLVNVLADIKKKGEVDNDEQIQ